MDTAVKHPVPKRVKFVLFDIRALWRSDPSVRVPGCQKLQITVWHRMLYSCTHMATVGVKGFHTSLSIDPYTLQLLPEIFKHVKRCCHFLWQHQPNLYLFMKYFFGAQCIDEYWNKWYTYTCSRTYSSKFSPQTTSKTSFCVFSSAPEFIVLNPDPTKWWGGFKRCRCLSVRLSVATRQSRIYVRLLSTKTT